MQGACTHRLGALVAAVAIAWIVVVAIFVFAGAMCIASGEVSRLE